MAEERKNSPLYYYLPMTCSLIFWGFMNVPSVIALRELSPFQLLLSRSAIATCVLAPLAFFREGRLIPDRGDRLMSIAMGVSGIAVSNGCYFFALKNTSMTNVAILYATTPLMTAILARIFLGETLTPRRVFGIVLALGGAVTLLCRGNLSLMLSMNMNRGDQFEVLAAFSASLMAILGRKIRRTPPITVTLCTMFTSTVVTSVVILASDEVMNFSPSVPAIWSTLYIGVFSSALAFLFQQVSVQRIGAGASSAFLNGSPALAIIGATMYFGETISMIQVVSAAIIFTGIFLNAGVAHKNTPNART